jgi:hypothetical protein
VKPDAGHKPDPRRTDGLGTSYPPFPNYQTCLASQTPNSRQSQYTTSSPSDKTEKGGKGDTGCLLAILPLLPGWLVGKLFTQHYGLGVGTVAMFVAIGLNVLAIEGIKRAWRKTRG